MSENQISYCDNDHSDTYDEKCNNSNNSAHCCSSVVYLFILFEVTGVWETVVKQSMGTENMEG